MNAVDAATASASVREQVRAARTLVVKIGSSAFTSAGVGVDVAKLDSLVDAIAGRIEAGGKVLVVSSGAVAAGLAPLGLPRRPQDHLTQRAAASVGQSALALAWGASFARYGKVVGQVLLSVQDFSIREHNANAQRTLNRLISLGAVPVINENDVVSTATVRLGDNDRVAALVAHLVGAEALVLLSDVDGVYDRNPQEPGAVRLDLVASAADLDGVTAKGGSGLGTGGMESKLRAARMAADAGVPVLVTSAPRGAEALLEGRSGTVFAPRAPRLSARKFWIRHAAEPAGSLVLDDGAVRAVTADRKSLLIAGVKAALGEFRAGDVVVFADQRGAQVARGVAGYGAVELSEALAGRGELAKPVVHADDVVPF
ncbi:glutamate 5-kinase [Segniliparus rugosus]|uniref:Glutamate 5-kinase n=1 Tax=Segniliparus rugosus (strain ATCC BAA-974 / DSM 45345 / CCUG 50838 / CIP 108380 / JCM 13579 / CDC 945) TaxID=679197 RepID=E5XNZ3_SEGRC|nr:glutamate 5-kinase [Segniliparus rugosus]EFV13932.1 glutamate 5-kinase [Segniliparus rugosus ATCC BAA-974]